MIGVVNLTNGLPQVVDTKELPIGKQFVPEAIVVLQNLVCIVTRRDFVNSCSMCFARASSKAFIEAYRFCPSVVRIILAYRR